jgi:hypothetical protein
MAKEGSAYVTLPLTYPIRYSLLPIRQESANKKAPVNRRF